jgi:Lrp/AsnC family leucine-responsive transcriptional regulator
MELDRFDRQLLNLLQADAGQTAERLAEQVGLSPSAIQRRIRKLREQGVIERDTAIVDPKHVGSPTVFVVSLQVERDRPETVTHLRDWLANEPNIQQAFYVTGEVDFVLVVTAASTAEYDSYMSRMLRTHPNIKRFTTNVVLGVLKRGLTIPVPLED